MKIEITFKDNESKILAPLKGKDVWLEATPEEIVRQKFIVHLVNELGYDLNQMKQELNMTNRNWTCLCRYSYLENSSR